VLKCVAIGCNMLQCVLQCVAVLVAVTCSVMQRVAACFSVMQCFKRAAMSCNVCRSVYCTVRCSALKFVTHVLQWVAMCCSVCCSVLQC